MAQLIKELEMSAGEVGFISVSKPPIAYPALSTLSNEEFSLGFDQGFIWHPEFISFQLLHVVSCDVKLFFSHKVNVEEDSVRAIIVPLFVPGQGVLNISDDDPCDSIEIESGYYRLLYQVRRLTDAEIVSSERYKERLDDILYLIEDDDRERPELCMLTFIPTTNVTKPKILKRDEDLSPPSKLVLLDESSSFYA